MLCEEGRGCEEGKAKSGVRRPDKGRRPHAAGSSDVSRGAHQALGRLAVSAKSARSGFGETDINCFEDFPGHKNLFEAASSEVWSMLMNDGTALRGILRHLRA